ncbi:MAG: DUF1829 domain-containing protein [Bacillota bacterium]|jgi:hypothetical protein
MRENVDSKKKLLSGIEKMSGGANDIKFTGKSEYDHLFDFLIPKSNEYPERVLKAVSNPTKDAAQSLVFAWIDTKEIGPLNSKAYAILNDSEKTVSKGAISAFENYSVDPILWSKRENVLEKFIL